MIKSSRGIQSQLDLLYTFCQQELARDYSLDQHLVLYRGSHDPDQYLIKESHNDCQNEIVEFDAVSSFSADVETAWEFGSAVWRVEVPISKIVFHSGLLQNPLLQGEQEFIILGGDYRVRRLRY